MEKKKVRHMFKEVTVNGKKVLVKMGDEVKLTDNEKKDLNRIRKKLNKQNNNWVMRGHLKKLKRKRNELSSKIAYQNSLKDIDKTQENIKKIEAVIKRFKPIKDDQQISSMAQRKVFFISQEWREMRFKILLRDERKCLSCFSTTKELHVDHIKPISLYWHLRLDPDNLQTLCIDCNIGKSNKYVVDFRG